MNIGLFFVFVYRFNILYVRLIMVSSLLINIDLRLEHQQFQQLKILGRLNSILSKNMGCIKLTYCVVFH